MGAAPLRVRFAPSPTGMIHLGNVRTALLNYLFAKQKNGTFILRIEDTDPERMFDPGAKQIMTDLKWLALGYDEGPVIKGPYAPYFQSERTPIYQEHLEELKKNNLVYKCFCTTKQLQKRRERQIALKQPPRYDRTCLKLSKEERRAKEEANLPFIWRFGVDQKSSITITDLAKGNITFGLEHFSDFPLTRQNGSFTFIFANAVDDMVMKMSHVLRGEDHLSNTANQAVLYKALGYELPLFWHLPILCNADGKKLSKRDFGFSLKDLQQAGYLPEALINYLAVVGGGSFANEIMSRDELIRQMPFDNIHSTGPVKYDVGKLQWVNHKWIEQLSPEQLLAYAQPFLLEAYPQAKTLSNNQQSTLLQIIKSEIKTLKDIKDAAQFYFEAPNIAHDTLAQAVGPDFDNIAQLVAQNIELIGKPEEFVKTLKVKAKEQKIGMKPLFTYLRLLLTGATHGPQLHDIIALLGAQEAKKRL